MLPLEVSPIHQFLGNYLHILDLGCRKRMRLTKCAISIFVNGWKQKCFAHFLLSDLKHSNNFVSSE